MQRFLFVKSTRSKPKGRFTNAKGLEDAEMQKFRLLHARSGIFRDDLEVGGRGANSRGP